MPIDPATAAGAVQGVIGGIQGILGGISARRSQKKLEKMIEGYKPNQSIMDYYSKALNKYNANPYQSASYNQNMKTAGQGLTTGISTLQSRGQALAGVGNLVEGYNNAGGRAAAYAEQDQAQDLAQLGQATGMKAAEDKYKFEAKYNLLAQKAGAANQTANAGIQNLYGGLGSIGDAYTINKMYGK